MDLETWQDLVMKNSHNGVVHAMGYSRCPELLTLEMLTFACVQLPIDKSVYLVL